MSIGAALNVVYGVFQNRVAVNNITGPDGRLELDDTDWGYGANVGLLYDTGQAPGRVDLHLAGRARIRSAGGVLGSCRWPWPVAGARGLLDAEVDLGLSIPQTVMLSGYREVQPERGPARQCRLAAVVAFGRVDVGVDSNDPVSLTTESTFDDTWHGALGLQRQMSETWRADLGVGYDSGSRRAGTSRPRCPPTRRGVSVLG